MEKREMLKGVLELVVLEILRIDGIYGYDILRRLRGTAFETKAGTLYPLLDRLRRQKLVTTRWAKVGKKRTRRMYSMNIRGVTKANAAEAFLELMLSDYRKITAL